MTSYLHKQCRPLWPSPTPLRFLLLTAILLILGGDLAVAQRVGQQKGRTVNANDYPGSDLGAKINAADKALGNSVGEIMVKGGGIIGTQIVISSDHTLRLSADTYVSKTSVIPILLKDRSSLAGSGLKSVITESTEAGQFTVVSAYNHSSYFAGKLLRLHSR